MKKLHAVWGTDKVFKYKWMAALYCAINAFNERMDSGNYGKRINANLKRFNCDVGEVNE